MKTLVLDNFHPYPDAIRSWALEQEFINRDSDELNKNYEGIRTRCLSELEPELYDEISRSILLNYYPDLWDKEYKIDAEMFIHVNTKKDMEEPIFKDWGRRNHLDSECLLTGIMYLTPFPEVNSGTQIHFTETVSDTISNRYNRMMVFPSGILHHSAVNYFGKDKYDGRMTLLFFLRKCEY